MVKMILALLFSGPVIANHVVLYQGPIKCVRTAKVSFDERKVYQPANASDLKKSCQFSGEVTLKYDQDNEAYFFYHYYLPGGHTWPKAAMPSYQLEMKLDHSRCVENETEYTKNGDFKTTEISNTQGQEEQFHFPAMNGPYRMYAGIHGESDLSVKINNKMVAIKSTGTVKRNQSREVRDEKFWHEVRYSIQEKNFSYNYSEKFDNSYKGRGRSGKVEVHCTQN